MEWLINHYRKLEINIIYKRQQLKIPIDLKTEFEELIITDIITSIFDKYINQVLL